MVERVCKNCTFWWLKVRRGFTACANPKNTFDSEQEGPEGKLKVQPFKGPNEFCDEWTDAPWPPATRNQAKPCGPSIIIVGTGVTRESYRYFLKIAPDAQVWTMNATFLPETTTHFEIHEKPVRPEIIQEAKYAGLAVWTRDNYPFGVIQRHRLGSTICYALAMAVTIGAKAVYLPGVDFGGKRDASEARGAEYWIGALEATGCYVWWSPLAKMMEMYNYGGYTC